MGRIEPQEFARVPRDGAGPYGLALYIAEQGGKHRDAKTLTGFVEAGVVEIVRDYHVLHAFQKKSKTRKTPRRDTELIKQRLREAERIARGEKL